ncbi:alanine racemase [Crocinitomicaceae bacterium CZZ-1]|uniref:Alanine racemase n=1 Tax=Taishania pollutisoli TaxID=2766479 RepID=A0A8J6PB50_9FLAO|nr:alanine racemase [Taishania pollutisoli]MBC9811562.1 alanine racemase [Taishania pollutisoli]NGF76239.1 alanine racemase [Fluviicola sp. SGL-29]
MKLSLSNRQLSEIVGGKNGVGENVSSVHSIVYDSRRIATASTSAFFALKGVHSDGHTFIDDAYEKGIRTFVVSENVTEASFPGACFIYVDDTLNALFRLAAYHRRSFKGKVVLISGKIGKTSVKEWLYTLLAPELSVSRSPKSYNSNLGIAISVLEANPVSDVVLIEVKPHEELNPAKINELLHPDLGILTTTEVAGTMFPDAYFEALYKGCTDLFHAERQRAFLNMKTAVRFVNPLKEELYPSEAKRKNVALAHAVALKMGISEPKLQEKMKHLPDLALRMETFEGKNGNFIINDLYNLDADAFRSSLEFQQALAKRKKRAVILGLQETDLPKKQALEELIREFKPDYFFLLNENETFTEQLKDTVILIKGSTSRYLLRIANQLKEKRHHTHLRINLKSLRKNIIAHKQVLPEGTKLMAMMKASGYGSGLDKMVQFVDGYGVDYFGVAFVDEGVAVRNAGIAKPIMVMNTEEDNYEACINHRLEPAIFDFQQLDDFISECIYQGVYDYPIHLKIDTGMRRLGFEPDQLGAVLEIIQSQPEVRIKSVYSHLAESDNLRDRRFTEHQIRQFALAVNKIRQVIDYPFEQHILNSPGIENYPTVDFSMARLGIGMYGISANPSFKRKLEPVISWYSVVSQVKRVAAGQSVGYSRSYYCKTDTIVAVVPVGYADGLRRSLSNGAGYLTINGTKCPIIGKVCMDMVMVDATNAKVKVGDEAEIIGPNCPLEKMAELLGTIPYEVMTSISERVHKVYVE